MAGSLSYFKKNRVGRGRCPKYKTLRVQPPTYLLPKNFRKCKGIPPAPVLPAPPPADDSSHPDPNLVFCVFTPRLSGLETSGPTQLLTLAQEEPGSHRCIKTQLQI